MTFEYETILIDLNGLDLEMIGSYLVYLKDQEGIKKRIILLSNVLTWARTKFGQEETEEDNRSIDNDLETQKSNLKKMQKPKFGKID